MYENKYDDVITLCLEPDMTVDEIKGAKRAISLLSELTDTKICLIYFVDNGIHFEVFGLPINEGYKCVNYIMHEMEKDGVMDFPLDDFKIKFFVEEEDNDEILWEKH